MGSQLWPSARGVRTPLTQLNGLPIEDFVLWHGLRFSGKEGAALRCEPLNQEYDPLKGDSLVAAARTEKGLDYVRL